MASNLIIKNVGREGYQILMPKVNSSGKRYEVVRYFHIIVHGLYHHLMSLLIFVVIIKVFVKDTLLLTVIEDDLKTKQVILVIELCSNRVDLASA